MDYQNVLSYLKEALYNEEYESCQGFIDYALQNGATSQDIDDIINVYLQGGSKNTASEGKIALNRIKVLTQKK